MDFCVAFRIANQSVAEHLSLSLADLWNNREKVTKSETGVGGTSALSLAIRRDTKYAHCPIGLIRAENKAEKCLKFHPRLTRLSPHLIRKSASSPTDSKIEIASKVTNYLFTFRKPFHDAPVAAEQRAILCRKYPEYPFKARRAANCLHTS